jgi:cell wall-associated NlpC family hydrolase
MSSAVDMDRSQAIIAAARTYLGTPFKHQGRLRGIGVDCIGLLVGAVRDAGYSIGDCADYGRAPNPRELLGEMSKHATRASRPFDQLRVLPDLGAAAIAIPGDVLVFWTLAPHLPRHVGLRTDTGLIHTWAEVGKVVEYEHGLGPEWAEQLHSVWRLKEAA